MLRRRGLGGRGVLGVCSTIRDAASVFGRRELGMMGC
jgi:hypothetical protein